MKIAARVSATCALVLVVSCARADTARQIGTCGFSPSDWCPSPPGDPCGNHADERSCRADAACRGMRYRGESVEACIDDGKGFWKNCPAIGCVSR